jgi:hypothetical protein
MSAEQTDKERIVAGIAGHKEKQDKILQAIKDHGNALHQDEFDKIFDDSDEGVQIYDYGEPESFILGDITGGLSRWIDLLQLMGKIGMIYATEINGKVVYSKGERMIEDIIYKDSNKVTAIFAKNNTYKVLLGDFEVDKIQGIKFQDGPVPENGVNGLTNEVLLAIIAHRIDQLNKEIPCRENSIAITKVQEALFWLEERTRNRF